MVGVDVEEARTEVRRAAQPPRAARRPRDGPSAAGRGRGRAGPAPRRCRTCATRGSASSGRPSSWSSSTRCRSAGPRPRSAPTTSRTRPTAAVWEPVEASGGTVAGADDPGVVGRLRDAATDPAVAAAITELGVEPLHSKEPTAAYVAQHVVGLLELTALRRIAEIKSKLQRTNPVEHAAEYNRMFGELAALEEHRRKLRDRIVGTQ